MKTVDKVLLSTLLVGVGVLVGMVLAWQPIDPLERVYQQYNHVRLYEDGSWEGESREGVRVHGCVPDAQCND